MKHQVHGFKRGGKTERKQERGKEKRKIMTHVFDFHFQVLRAARSRKKKTSGQIAGAGEITVVKSLLSPVFRPHRCHPAEGVKPARCTTVHLYCLETTNNIYKFKAWVYKTRLRNATFRKLPFSASLKFTGTT